MNESLNFQSADVMVGPYRTHYLTWGEPSGQPILLLHDGAVGGSAEVSWARFSPALAAAGYFVIAPDLLGFGDTDKIVQLGVSPYGYRIDHVASLLEVLGVHEPVHVIGNSFGGSLVLRALAGADRLNIRSATSINGSGGPWRTPLALDELGKWDGTKIDLARIVQLLIDPGPWFEEHLEARFRAATIPGHYRALKAPSTPLPEALGKTEMYKDAWPAGLGETDRPLLLIGGKRDTLLDESWIEQLTQGAPSSEVVWLDGKHASNIDDEVNLLSAVIPFLSSH